MNTNDVTLDSTIIPADATPDTSENSNSDFNVFDTLMETPSKKQDDKPMPDFQLPSRYLENNFYITATNGRSKYPDPSLTDNAKEIGQNLAAAGMKTTEFNKMLRELKKVKKSTLPVEAQTGALSALIPKALLLEKKKRAPHLLVSVLEANRNAVKDYKDFVACYNHLESVGIYLDLNQPSKDKTPNGEGG